MWFPKGIRWVVGIASVLLCSIAAKAKVEPRSEAELRAALINADACSASGRDPSFNTEDYYFAFIVSVDGFGGFVYLNAPLTKEEAMIVLANETLVNELIYKHCDGSVGYGVYTDMEAKAHDLACSFGFTPVLHNHINSLNVSVGEFL